MVLVEILGLRSTTFGERAMDRLKKHVGRLPASNGFLPAKNNEQSDLPFGRKNSPRGTTGSNLECGLGRLADLPMPQLSDSDRYELMAIKSLTVGALD